MSEQMKEFLEMKEERLLRLRQVLELIPVSRSAWFAGVASGKYPKSFKLGEKTTVWKLSSINELIASLGV